MVRCSCVESKVPGSSPTELFIPTFFFFPFFVLLFSIKHLPARWSPAALTELLTVKKQCKRIFHGNEWMKEHNYAFQNADTRPGLQSRTQNICFVISISAVILKRMVKITSIFGSYSFLRIALHDIFLLSHHLLASWNLFIPRVAESKSKCLSSRQV